jgi:chloramphenicol-sensitive protein RarD
VERQRAGVITGLAAYFIWGLLTLFWKQLHRFNAFELIGWRICSSALIMVIIVSVTRRWAGVLPVFRNRALFLRVLLAALMLAINWTSYVWAVVHDHVLETALGYFISPLATVLLGVFALKETLHTAQVIALGLAATAVVVLTVSYGQVPWIALGLAVSWTAYGWLKRAVPLGPVESMTGESLVLLLPAMITAIALSGRATSIPGSGSGKEVTFAVLTGLATVTPLMMFAFAAHRVPLTIIGPMLYIIPSINFLLGWLVFHEDMPPSRFVGFALVWTALAVLFVDTARRAHATRGTTRLSGGPFAQ